MTPAIALESPVMVRARGGWPFGMLGDVSVRLRTASVMRIDWQPVARATGASTSTAGMSFKSLPGMSPKARRYGGRLGDNVATPRTGGQRLHFPPG